MVIEESIAIEKKTKEFVYPNLNRDQPNLIILHQLFKVCNIINNTLIQAVIKYGWTVTLSNG